jgi:chromate transporter
VNDPSRSVPGESAPTHAFGWSELRDALSVWPLLALYSFGSTAVQLAAMHRVLVKERRWISEERFLNALNYCMAIPGPEAQQLAVYVGWITHRLPGGLLAGVLFLLPGVTCIMALSYLYVAGDNSAAGDALLFGVKPAILAITIGSTVQIWNQILRTRLMIAVAVLAFVATFFFDLAFLIVVLTAAAFGLCGGLTGFGTAALQTDTLPLEGLENIATASADFSQQNDLSQHTRLTIAGLLRVSACCMILWFVPLLLLIVFLGADNVFSQIAILSSKSAILTFGGPYGATAYISDQAVTAHGWLTHDQMLDGIAMAELSPGPSILFLQFAGFMGPYRNPGMLPPLVAGTFGGLLSAWIIFVPTFWYIFLVAPFIEVFRSNKVISATLSAVTGAVIGILVTFAIRLATLTIFHKFRSVDGFGLDFIVPEVTSIEPWSLAICIVAGIAVFKFRLGIVPAVILSCVAGIMLLLVGVQLR